ncbi:MAG: O-antigen ligase family protein [Actinomycetota bacterium]|nr:O-antigen ligase family protein [Actinomycetota bacterium]
MSPGAAQYTAAREVAPSRWIPWDIDRQAVSTWVLSLALVLYLALDGGGYALAAHGQVGIAVWWVVVLAAAWGLLPAAWPTRAAGWSMALFAAFTAWTALGITWSLSSGRSFQDLALVSCYLGILVLAAAIHRERGAALRHTTAAVATAIVVVAALAIASRLSPHLFPGSGQTAQFLGGARARLYWPLGYWNALAALMAMGVPLLLAQVTSARTLAMQALAAAAIPLVALCDALTLSRGGAGEAAAAVIVFIALAPGRIPKLASTLVAGAGSAVLVYAGLDRHAVQQGLTGAALTRQGSSLVLTGVLVCAGMGVAQLGVGLLARHGTLPRVLRVSPGRARVLTAASVVVLVAAAIAAGAPHHLYDAWQQFKNAAGTPGGSSVLRLASANGEGRYQYWVAAVNSASSHILTGSGPGTFQLDWLPRAQIAGYVVNAHSLYVETYAELGLIGLALLAAFFVIVLAVIARVITRTAHEERTLAAATGAAVIAFMVGASFDWLWQMPVLVAVLMLLIAAVSAPAEAPVSRRLSRGALPVQLAAVAAGLVCLVAIAYPLAVNSAVAGSQQAAGTGNLSLALTDARSAVRLEPGSGQAQLQLALVYEAQGAHAKALAAAEHAVRDDAHNWSNWLVLSRLQAEDGHAHAALVAYLKARSLNPRSSLFANA